MTTAYTMPFLSRSLDGAIRLESESFLSSREPQQGGFALLWSSLPTRDASGQPKLMGWRNFNHDDAHEPGAVRAAEDLLNDRVRVVDLRGDELNNALERMGCDDIALAAGSCSRSTSRHFASTSPANAPSPRTQCTGCLSCFATLPLKSGARPTN